MNGSLLDTLDLPRRVQEHPYQTMLVAAGVGYLLAGGLFTKLTTNVLRVGARVATIPVVQAQLLAVATAALAPRPTAQPFCYPTNDHPSEGSAR